MEFGIVLLGQVISFAALLAGTKLTTQILLPEEFGLFGIYLVTVSAFSQLVFGYLLASMTRFGARRFPEKDVARTISFVTIVSALAVGLVACVMMIHGEYLLESMAAGYLSFQALNMLISAANNASRLRVKVAAVVISESIFRTALLFGLAKGHLMWGSDINAVMAIYSMAALLALLVNVLLSGSCFKGWLLPASFDKKSFKSIAGYGFPISVNSMVYWLQSGLDKIALGYFGGLALVGKYSIAFQFSYTVIMLGFDVVMSYVTPIVFQKFELGEHKKYITSVLFLLVPTFMIAPILFYYYAEFIVEIFANKTYFVSSELMVVMVVAAEIYCLTQLISLIKFSQMDSKALSYARSLIIIIGVFLYYPALTYFSISGLVFVLLLANISQLACAIHFSYR